MDGWSRASRLRASAMVNKRINLRGRVLVFLSVLMLLVVTAMVHLRTATYGQGRHSISRFPSFFLPG